MLIMNYYNDTDSKFIDDDTNEFEYELKEYELEVYQVDQNDYTDYSIDSIDEYDDYWYYDSLFD